MKIVIGNIYFGKGMGDLATRFTAWAFGNHEWLEGLYIFLPLYNDGGWQKEIKKI